MDEPAAADRRAQREFGAARDPEEQLLRSLETTFKGLGGVCRAVVALLGGTSDDTPALAASIRGRLSDKDKLFLMRVRAVAEAGARPGTATGGSRRQR